ncbi:MAG: hypothetical protein BWK78_00360 [Thiotrichaceae bacterium IS1]|nr:MAG: hypothetical protein BWK78_00360 [Thiotrichaceae bacterium IS1]
MNQASEVLNFIYSFKRNKIEYDNSLALALVVERNIEERNIIAGILTRRNQRVPLSTDYLQQLREEGRP